MGDLSTYRQQLESTMATYEKSLKSWRAREKVYVGLLDSCARFPQIAKNPIDDARLDFIQDEIQKQEIKHRACFDNLRKFNDLERQMKELAIHVPEEKDIIDEETMMEIREELDDEDNVVSATVQPHDACTKEQVQKLLNQVQGPATISSKASNVQAEASTSLLEQDLETQSSQVASTAHVNPYSTKIPDDVLFVEDHPEPAINADHYAIGLLPEGVRDMADISKELLLEEDDASSSDESEDEFGRSKHTGTLPIPELLQRPKSSQEARNHMVEHQRRHSADPVRPQTGSARSKKKIVFADDLVQGPTSSNGTPARAVLKKSTAYPITGGDHTVDSPSIPGQARFQIEQSSTDVKLATRHHALPSKAYQAKLDTPMKDLVVERNPPELSEADRQRLFPQKINLAAQDLDPEEGVTKRPMMIRKMTDEEMAAIQKKRAALGKKNHKRRKSTDPTYPARSGSWDESQDPPTRPKSAGTEVPVHDLQLQRAKEIIKAQEDIAWANTPITPDLSPQESTRIPATPKEPSGIISPQPKKPPTPERTGSWNTNIPSPLSQEVKGITKEVQFSEEVVKRLEPLSENPEEPSVVIEQRKARKLPPKEPKRKPSIDPASISPTPGSPPPEGRQSGPLATEEEGSIKHHMVRSTPKSPPPHVAIHDLLGDTPEHIRQAVRQESLSPTTSSEINPMDTALNGTIDIDIDEEMHRKEIAQEYHKLRSRTISREGGYLASDEPEIQPLEAEPSPGKRISRFKAARLGQA